MSETKELAHQILEIIPLLMRSVNAKLRQTDHMKMTAHFRLLWILEHRSWSLSELAEHQSVSLPTMSNSVTILEERGWIRRVRSEEDRRKVVIELTQEGFAVLAEVRQNMADQLDTVIEKMNYAQQAKVSEALLILRDTFNAAHYGDCEHEST